MFLFTSLRSLNYIEYIVLRNKKKHMAERQAEFSAAIIILLVLFFRIWNTVIDYFILPWEYVMLISLLLF